MTDLPLLVRYLTEKPDTMVIEKDLNNKNQAKRIARLQLIVSIKIQINKKILDLHLRFWTYLPSFKHNIYKSMFKFKLLCLVKLPGYFSFIG